MQLVLSNDDGVEAEGIATLHSVLVERSECLIVAPSGPQSGVGHAVTTTEPMPLQELGPRRFSLGGTPADCARVAFGRSGAFAKEAFAGSIDERINVRLGVGRSWSESVPVARTADGRTSRCMTWIQRIVILHTVWKCMYG